MGGGGALGARGGPLCLGGGGAGGGGAGYQAKQGGRGGDYGASGNPDPPGDLEACQVSTAVGAAGPAVRTNGHALTFLGDSEAPYVRGPID